MGLSHSYSGASWDSSGDCASPQIQENIRNESQSVPGQAAGYSTGSPQRLGGTWRTAGGQLEDTWRTPGDSRHISRAWSGDRNQKNIEMQ